MADNVATQRRNSQGIASGTGDAYAVKSLCASIETPALADGDTITFGRIPSVARILAASEYANDDLATTGAPTLDIGLFNDSGSISDEDALTDGIDLANLGNGKVVGERANYGKLAWELVSGQTSDPGGELIVRGTCQDAATDTVGTVTVDILYTLD